jgi:OOP family OmpA-OmpF porin
MKKAILFIITILSFFSNQALAQNLVPNPSFEIQDSCPTRRFQRITLATGWKSATRGTADYYHSCGGEFRHPYGTKKPYEGKAYAGIANDNNYREYIMTQLGSPLEKGATYKVKMYVNASNLSNYNSPGIGIYFTNDSYFGRINAGLIDVTPQIENPRNQIIPTNKWTEISGSFIAEGEEEFIVIGYFKKEIYSINISEKETKHKTSYIFIDNVSTTLLKRPKLKLPPKGESKILKTIYFENDKYSLNKESFDELNELTKLLNDSKHVKIEVIGYTDSSGSEEHNLTLSKYRALAVVNYLIKKGISKERIKHKGLGNSIPINSKDKSNKKALNRRVEFRVID